MVSQDFSSIKLADSQIHHFVMDGKEVSIVFLDWQQKEFCVIFSDFLGVQAINFANVDLSHGTVNKLDPFLNFCLEAYGETSEEYRCFAIWSAWDNNVVIRIVAKDFRIKN